MTNDAEDSDGDSTMIEWTTSNDSEPTHYSGGSTRDYSSERRELAECQTILLQARVTSIERVHRRKKKDLPKRNQMKPLQELIEFVDEKLNDGEDVDEIAEEIGISVTWWRTIRRKKHCGLDSHERLHRFRRNRTEPLTVDRAEIDFGRVGQEPLKEMLHIENVGTRDIVLLWKCTNPTIYRFGTQYLILPTKQRQAIEIVKVANSKRASDNITIKYGFKPAGHANPPDAFKNCRVIKTTVIDIKQH